MPLYCLFVREFWFFCFCGSYAFAAPDYSVWTGLLWVLSSQFQPRAVCGLFILWRDGPLWLQRQTTKFGQASSDSGCRSGCLVLSCPASHATIILSFYESANSIIFFGATNKCWSPQQGRPSCFGVERVRVDFKRYGWMIWHSEG